MNASEIAAKALARASLFDPRTREDAAIVAVWADIIELHQIPEHYMLQAVSRFYEEPRSQPIQVGDAVRIARDLRTADTLRNRGAELAPGPNAGALPRGSGPSTHPGGLNAVGAPVRDAYEADNAIRFPCPRCSAQPGQVCTWRGKQLKIPCVARLVDARQASHVEVIEEHPNF